MIRCRLCTWSHERTEDAWDLLREHFDEEHSEQFWELNDRLDEHEAARLGGGA